MTKRHLLTFIRYAFLFTGVLLVVFPMLFIFISSFKHSSELYGSPWALPAEWDFSPYIRLFTEYGFGRAFFNSARYSMIGCVATALLITPCAYAITRMRWRLSKLALGFVMLGIMIPIHAIVIPLYATASKVNIPSTTMLQLIFILAAVFAVVTFLFPMQILRIYTNEPEVAAEGIGYLRVTAFIFLLHGTSLVMSNIMRAVGNAKLGLYTSMISFVVNIGANYVLIFGKLGFPALGVTGAALGTLVARSLECAVCFIYVFCFEKELRYRPKGLLIPPGRKMLSEFRRLGLPAVISDFLLGLAGTAVIVVLGHMGKEVVSANSIVMVVDRMCTIAISGVASASSVVIGHTVGEGMRERAMKEGRTFLLLSALIGLLGSVIVLVVGEWTIGFYGITPATREIAVRMMEMSAVIVFFQAMQSALSKGILRGGGDTRFLMVADILFQWCASIPLGYLTGLILHWEPEYVLLMLRIDYIIKTVWLVFRLHSGKWIHKVRKIS